MNCNSRFLISQINSQHSQAESYSDWNSFSDQENQNHVFWIAFQESTDKSDQQHQRETAERLFD